MPRPVIVADETIPFATEAFGTLGDVRLRHGREISREDLVDADLLVVRAVTRVDGALLTGTRVRFVGTATSGIDHVSLSDLERLGVAFSAAHGCNANAVAEYMTAAWVTIASRLGVGLRGLRVGVIGVGHVGSMVVEKARALGMIPVLNDPPLARQTGRAVYRPLDELSDCDIVTCHAPLTVDGLDPTFRLIGDAFFSTLKRGAWFCNAGRGEVVDEAALQRILDSGRLGAAVLDVWDHEPAIDARLLERVNLATPHVAGYSFEGKLNGTRMVYDAACRFVGVAPAWDPQTAVPPPDVPAVEIDATGRSDVDVLAELVSRLYPIERDDEALRRTGPMTPDERGREFDRLRKAYQHRREFGNTVVRARGASVRLLGMLRGLGFEVAARG
ncbi:MAG: 4-phosphoerythronate dehydrogenase [Acidobacteriota bacterium]